jgi:hypothetical protein
MSPTVPTDSLMRFLQATPEQRAAIDRFLLGASGGPGGGDSQGGEGGIGDAGGVLDALMRIEEKVDAVLKSDRGGGAELLEGYLPQQKGAISESEAAQVFRLFGELLAMGTDLVAPPARVFDLMVFKKLTKAETALECKCVASLITKRVALIERHFAMPIERLRAFASDLKERQRTVRGDRYARKKQGAVQDEREQYDAGDKEDDNGYLPEES